MNYLKSAIFGSSATNSQPAEKAKQEEQTKGEESSSPNEEDILNHCMPAELQEEMFCFTMGECQLHTLALNSAGKQTMTCEFMNAGIHIAQMPFDYDGNRFQMPCLVVSNDDYDEDQDQKQEEKLPIAESLIFMRYEKEDDDGQSQQKQTTIGYVFFYPDLGEHGLCKVIEADPDATPEMRSELKQFEQWICRIVYAMNERKALRVNSRSQSVLEEQDKRCANYCIPTDLSVLMAQSHIGNIFFNQSDQPNLNDQGPENSGQEESKEPTGLTLTQQKQKTKADQARRMKKAVNEDRETKLVDKMSNLQVGQEDLMLANEIQMQVVERLIQIVGHFFKYDVALNKNILIKEGLFLCVDKVLTAEQKEQYMIHIVDPSQTHSYCRTPIMSEALIQFNKRDQLLMWVGQPKNDGSVPAWVFYLVNDTDVQSMQGVITKCLFEMNHQMMQEEANTSKSSESGANDGWLEAQLITDRADVDMEGGSELISDFEYDQHDGDDHQNLRDIDDIFDRQEAFDAEESRLDEDLEPEFREGENKECLQALAYDRAFVVNGPVVKVYKNGEDEDQGDDQQRLKYLMHLPVIRDSRGDILEPTNMMLHNNESSLLFIDKNDSNRVVSYDLEAGAISDEFKLRSKLGEQGAKMIVNEFKNASNTASQIFQGMNERNMFTIDPRVNSESRIATERPYKTNPMFSAIGTSMSGSLAMGSYDGKIRLYKQVGQDAKTLLPGLGDPIKSVEVSRDGLWVLATTQTYLLCIPTMCSNGKTGFEHRMGKEKPNPFKLQIKATDISKFRLGSLDFKPAKFNNFSSNGEESSIVTSTGKFLITWNFKKVKRGILNEYQIKQLDTAPVDNQFQLDHEEKILVTDQKNVGLQSRKKKTYIQY